MVAGEVPINFLSRGALEQGSEPLTAPGTRRLAAPSLCHLSYPACSPVCACVHVYELWVCNVKNICFFNKVILLLIEQYSKYKYLLNIVISHSLVQDLSCFK